MCTPPDLAFIHGLQSYDDTSHSLAREKVRLMVSFNGNEAALRKRISTLEAKVQALQGEEERTTIALAAGEVGIFDWNLEHRRIYLSPILLSLLGYEDEPMPDNINDWLPLIHAEHRFQAEHAVREALVYGKEQFQGLYKIIRKDGTTRLFLFRATIMRQSRAEGGSASRILGSVIDLTESPAMLA